MLSSWCCKNTLFFDAFTVLFLLFPPLLPYFLSAFRSLRPVQFLLLKNTYRHSDQQGSNISHSALWLQDGIKSQTNSSKKYSISPASSFLDLFIYTILNIFLLHTWNPTSNNQYTERVYLFFQPFSKNSYSTKFSINKVLNIKKIRIKINKQMHCQMVIRISHFSNGIILNNF